ncbi:MAG TPA: AAA family ATPase, partial [Thermoanaerobaculia bacterium]|nr:AAA family ATPase [Thermoanaerobaculia bacterium]
ALRFGIHTGPAVVWNRPGQADRLQLGSTLDLALGIQSAAPVNGIAVSAMSRRLLARHFATRPLPPARLPNVDGPAEIYEAGEPLEGWQHEGAPVAPLVNREAEIQILLDRFRLAGSGAGGQAVLIAGEPGIGKSRLIRALSEQLAAEAPIWLTAQGSTLTQNTPLAPIAQLLTRALSGADDSTEGSDEERLRRLEEVLDEHDLPRPESTVLLGELLALPVADRYPPLALSPEARRKRTLAAILVFLGGLAERRPVVAVIEDLHWIDPSTLELLDLLLGELPMLSLLLVATFRTEFSATWRPTAVTQLSLSGLNESQTKQLVAQVAEGKGLPAEVHREIVVRTDGNPLFIEELTKAALEAEAPLHEPASVPLTLGASLLARLDRLGDAKEVAQLAAVLGRTFSLELLEALSWIKGASLSSALARLVQAEILYRQRRPRGVGYIFKHALIQDVAYMSLLASDRQQLHRRLVGLFHEEFPEVAEAEPELMAHHCERGGLVVESVDYLLGAGVRAAQRSAYLEAMSHLNRALDLLYSLPLAATPATAAELLERELSVRSMLIVVLEAVKGWGAPEVAANAERCAVLCREVGDHASLIPALSSLWAHHLLRGDRQPTVDLADRIARLAETPAQRYMGYATRAYTAYYSGRYTEALDLSEEAVKLYEPGILSELAIYGDDSILMPHLMKSWALWMLGELENSIFQQEAVHAIVETLSSPFAVG